MNSRYLLNLVAKRLPLSDSADDIMEREDYIEYVMTHGYHFTDSLAECASKRLSNADGTNHHWTAEQVRSALKMIPEEFTLGDATYLANMLYSDFYPNVLKTEQEVINATSHQLADKDGYKGMIFMRWLSDMIGRGIVIEWEKYI